MRFVRQLFVLCCLLPLLGALAAQWRQPEAGRADARECSFKPACTAQPFVLKQERGVVRAVHPPEARTPVDVPWQMPVCRPECAPARQTAVGVPAGRRVPREFLLVGVVELRI